MSKLNKSESGKLGSIKSKIVAQIAKEERVKNYNENPSVCKGCYSALEYNKRNYLFCSSACSASYNNKLRNTKTNKWVCKNCQKEHISPKGKLRIYCNITCQQEYQNKERIYGWLYNNENWGEMGTPKWVKNHLIKINGRKCSSCDLSIWKEILITLEVNHIDGNATNNSIENLELLCPNCHSITETYKGKNRGNGRKKRYQVNETDI